MESHEPSSVEIARICACTGIRTELLRDLQGLVLSHNLGSVFMGPLVLKHGHGAWSMHHGKPLSSRSASRHRGGI